MASDGQPGVLHDGDGFASQNLAAHRGSAEGAHPGHGRWSVKHHLRRAIVQLGERTTGRARSNRVVVLCYHSIHPDRSFASAGPSQFRRQLAWLKEACNVVPLDTLLRMPIGESPGRPTVALTFDDGYDDNHEFALPLLLEYGVPATVYVTAGFVNRDPAVLQRMRFLRHNSDDVHPLTWSQVRELSDAGVEIGGHTYSHPNLARLSAMRAQEEVSSAKSILEDGLGKPVRSFAYPFGKIRRHFTAETMKLVEEAGYQNACAVIFRGLRQSDSRFAIPRFFVHHDTPEQLAEKVFGAWDLIGRWQERSPMWAGKLISPGDFHD